MWLLYDPTLKLLKTVDLEYGEETRRPWVSVQLAFRLDSAVSDAITSVKVLGWLVFCLFCLVSFVLVFCTSVSFKIL